MGPHDVDRARARAQVADNVRAVRGRVQRHTKSGSGCEPANAGERLRALPGHPAQASDDSFPCWRGTVPRAAALAGRPHRDETASPTRFLIENPARFRRAYRIALDNLPVLILVVIVVLSALHTFVSLRAAAYAFGAIALVVVPLGASVALHGLVEARWPVVVKRRRR